jgi:hypothetical protein
MVTGGNGGGSVATAVATLATAITGVGLGLQQPRHLVVAHTCEVVAPSVECSVNIPYQPQLLAVFLGSTPHFIGFLVAFLCPRSCRRRRGFVDQ